MRRVLCWLRGHKWRVVRTNERKHINLIHLHTMAGMDADCLRCGEQWRDAVSQYFPEQAEKDSPTSRSNE